jgi:predicted Zn-dependent protease
MIPDLFRPKYLRETDIIITDFIRSFSLTEQCYEPGEVDKFPLLFVMVHEMGHVLGLNHYLGNTVMTPEVGYRDPSPTIIDIEKVKHLYPEYFR